MKNLVCPLCGTENGENIENKQQIFTDINDSRPDLQNIIYKHLNIKINDNGLHYVCVLCEQTVRNWNQFAIKCWEVHNDLVNTTIIENNIKLEGVEIKIEHDNIQDDYPSNQCDDVKNEDPLVDVIKSETIKNINRKKPKRKRTIYSKRLKSKKSITAAGSENQLKSEDGSLREDNTTNNKIKLKIFVEHKKKPSTIDFSCYLCAAKITSWMHLEHHFTSEHSSFKAKVLCICGKFLNCRTTFHRHINLHDESRGFKCDECGRKFGERRDFKEHLLSSHLPEENYKYKCNQCPKKFLDMRMLRKHKNIHLPPEIKNILACDVCGDKFPNKSNLKAHKLAKHEKTRNHVCDLCGQSFIMKGNLKTHIITIHTDIRNFACDECPRKFKLSNELKRHKKNTHINQKVKCPHCPAVLKNIRTLRCHQDIHNNVYRCSCTLCGKEFRSNQDLKMHMNSHNGVKPYICQWCSLAYATRQNLNMHIKKAHSGLSMKSEPPKTETTGRNEVF